MKRRTFVTVAGSVGTGGLVALSGCNAPMDGGEDGDGNGTTEADENGDEPAGDGDDDGDTTTETTTEDGETTTEDGETTGEEGGGDGGTTQVQMVTEGDQFYFDPIGLAVEPGTTVEWVNETPPHSSTAYAEGNGGAEVRRIPEDAEAWNSETLTEEGATFSYTFETEGTYDYFCIPHKSLEMVGRVVCGEPGGPAEGDMPPDGEVPESQTIVDQGEVSYDDFSG